jgi:hypothetical protein
MNPVALLLAFLLLRGASLAQFPCDCVPRTLPSKQQRSEAKYIGCEHLHPFRDTITPGDIMGWDARYKTITAGVTDAPGSSRLKSTPEDSVYVLKGYIWFVRRIRDDCDFHIEIGGSSPDDKRIIAEVKNRDCPLRRKLNAAIEAQGEKICKGGNCSKYHFRKGLPVIIIGAGFFDASHAADGNHGDEHTRHSLWEIHPVTDIIFL